MSDVNILNQLIKENAKVSISENYGKKQVRLTEPAHSQSFVIIHNIPDNTVIVKADAFKSPDTVFNGSRGECKRADFIIAADTGKKKVIICIEMKATKDSEKEIIQQLAGSKCFVAYCREIGKAFWNHKTFLDDYVYRFVSIGHTSIAKKKTRITRQDSVHDRPEKMMKIMYPHHLEFDHIAGA